jgi:hypothetical protein
LVAAAERLFQAPARLMRDPMGRLLCRRAGRWCSVSEPLQRALAGGTAQCAVDAAPPLRHLCDKTGTRRQLELVARLLGQAPREAALELA